MTLLRHPVKPEDFHRGYDDQAINDACNTLYGIGDLQLVEDAMVSRFARTIERTKDEDTGTVTTKMAGFSAKWDLAAKAAIQAGQYEICRLDLFGNITGATATLFSEPGQKYEYSNENAGKLITAKRIDAGTTLSDLRWDTVAVGVGSCALYLEVKGDKLTETEVRPTALWVIFAESILDDEHDRSTDGMNIDEASLVIMQLAGEKYAAWWGPSKAYPVGRHCVYSAKKFSDIPKPEAKDGREYTISGEYKEGVVGSDELANPLSLWGGYSKTNPPVYPFSILYGTPLSTGLLPTSTSLYKTGLEIDLLASVILGASGKGARGAQVLKSTADSDPSDVPDNTSEGLIVLGRGKELEFTGQTPLYSTYAMDVLSDQSKKIAATHHVPGYMAMDNDRTEVPSGIAIRRLNEPRLDYRRLRIEMNKASVARRWAVEKALLNATDGKATIPEDTTETWNAGAMEFAIDATEKLTEWEQRIKIGESSILDVLMDMRGFSNANDALVWAKERMDLIEANKEVLDYFKPSAAPAAAPARGGLFGGRQ